MGIGESRGFLNACIKNDEASCCILTYDTLITEQQVNGTVFVILIAWIVSSNKGR
jgi:hypothetical protein